MKPFLNLFRSLSMGSLLVLIVGCASAPSGPSPESLLTAAGFKTVVASTDKQIQHLPTLPAGQVTVISQTGKNFYVYPNLAKNQLYVGTAREYQAYLRLRAQNNLPPPDPEAAYLKADAAMVRANAQDQSNPWTWWPEFGALGWQY